MVAPATKASVLDFVWDNLSSLDKVVEVLLSSDFNPDRFMTAELLDLAESACNLLERSATCWHIPGSRLEPLGTLMLNKFARML